MSIIPYSGQSFDIHVPICVVGGGGCGLTAAISAAQSGAEVAVLEADQSPAGSTSMTISLICAAGTKLQSDLGIEDNADILFEDIMKAARGQTDEQLAKFLSRESGPTIDWLCDEVGCDLSLETSWPGYGHSVLRAHGTPNRNGEELIAMLLAGAKEAGVEIVTQAKVSSLIVDDKETVVGLCYQSPVGEVQLGCDAVILASSGYGANRDLVANHIPEMAKATYYGCEHHQGDALIWGEALGAKIADLGSYQGVGTHAIPYDYGLPHTVMIDGGIKVNVLGQRYENEVENISKQAADALAQPGGVAWIVYDDRAHEKAKSLFAGYRDHAKLLTEKVKADTMEDLAEIAKIDKEGLVSTFSQIDELIKAGIPCPFGRSFTQDHVLKPPFYAVKVVGALYHTQGGLCIDDTARVKKKSGGRFENLFAGGGAARSVSGPAEWGYLPAMGLATATIFGRVAGREAAKYCINKTKGVSNGQSETG